MLCPLPPGQAECSQELAYLHQAQRRKDGCHQESPGSPADAAGAGSLCGPGDSWLHARLFLGCSVLPPDGCVRPHLHICSGRKGWCRIKLFLPPPSLILGSSGQGEQAPWQPAWLGTWVPGRWGVRLLHCCPQWLWPPSPTEQEREKGQDAWSLSLTPSSPVVKLGPWAVPAAPKTSSALRAHRPFSVPESQAPPSLKLGLPLGWSGRWGGSSHFPLPLRSPGPFPMGCPQTSSRIQGCRAPPGKAHGARWDSGLGRSGCGRWEQTATSSQRAYLLGHPRQRGVPAGSGSGRSKS